MADHPELKKLRGFIIYSDEQASKNPVFSYYLKVYACEKIYQRIKELKPKGENVAVLE